jgi:hypothetical protein
LRRGELNLIAVLERLDEASDGQTARWIADEPRAIFERARV